MPNKIMQALCSNSWAITPHALQNIALIASRQNETVEAVEKKLGRKLDNTQTTKVRGSTAIIPVSGPIFRYANMFTDISGATSIAVLARDFNEALENSAIENIILEIDSPGGQVAGVSEFADMVRAAHKPVIAYVSDMGASAAYWIAAAADEIVISKTSVVGSIGVVATLSAANDDGTIEIVSTQSPDKRVDVKTKEGRGKIQKEIDSLAKVFVSSVAVFRGVDEETVLADFGKGGVLVGEDAVAVGMVDRVGSLESLITGLSGNDSTIGAVSMSKETGKVTESVALTVDTLKANHSEIYNAVFAVGVDSGKSAECERIKGVEAQLIPGHESIVSDMKFDGKSTGADAAMKILGAHRAQMTSSLDQIKSDAPKPVATVDAPLIPATPKNLSVEDKAKADYATDPNLADEFGSVDAYVAYEVNTKNGNAGILNRGNK